MQGFVCKRFVTKSFTRFADKDWLSDLRNNIIIDNHKQSANHNDYVDIFNS